MIHKQNRVNTYAHESVKDTSKTTKSEVWQHFTKIDYISARCNTCLKSIKHKGNTTNMMQHLRRSHWIHIPLLSSTRKHKSQTSSQNANLFKHVKFTEGNDSSEDIDDPPSKVQINLKSNIREDRRSVPKNKLISK